MSDFKVEDLKAGLPIIALYVILLFVAVVAIGSYEVSRRDCVEKGGHYLRGMWGMECIQIPASK